MRKPIIKIRDTVELNNKGLDNLHLIPTQLVLWGHPNIFHVRRCMETRYGLSVSLEECCEKGLGCQSHPFEFFNRVPDLEKVC